MTPHLKLLLATAIALFIGGCVQEGHYPVSGEDCAPGDPVQDMDSGDFNCAPPA